VPSAVAQHAEIYAESFQDEAHLDAIVAEARQMAGRALAA